MLDFITQSQSLDTAVKPKRSMLYLGFSLPRNFQEYVCKSHIKYSNKQKYEVTKTGGQQLLIKCSYLAVKAFNFSSFRFKVKDSRRAQDRLCADQRPFWRELRKRSTIDHCA